MAKFNNITFGGNVQYIAENAFDNRGDSSAYAGLTGKLYIQSSVKHVWKYAFANCDGITEIKYDNGVSISPEAFVECNVTP